MFPEIFIFKILQKTVVRFFVPLSHLVMLFKDNLYNVPAETDKYLSAHYGSTFMQPDPNFSESEASNIKYYSLEEKEGIAFIYRNI